MGSFMSMINNVESKRKLPNSKLMLNKTTGSCKTMISIDKYHYYMRKNLLNNTK